MNSTNKILITGILVLTSTQMLANTNKPHQYKHEEITESRIALDIPEKYKNHLLYDMRNGLFPTLQQVIKAVNNDKMDEAATIAAKRGITHFKTMDLKFLSTLPKAMKMLGKNMHMGFDDIAKSARTGNKQATFKKIVKQFDNCTACHNTYHFK